MNGAIQLKVCGMRDRDNIAEVLLLQPDYMGFIFFASSPRYVGDDFGLPEDFPAHTKKVGVFVNASTDYILSRVREFDLNFVQLHGNEKAVQCGTLRDSGVGVIKAISVEGSMDLQQTAQYNNLVDYFLFDTKGKYFGGNARTFNWDILADYDQKVPFFLSGGIGPNHIDAIKKLSGYNLKAIDVNSGVETRPAFKDADRIRLVKQILESKT
jgi:phosphoribosylanthranilate isomerase